MKKLMTCLALGTFATLLGVASAPAANAQSDRENSTFTVTEPIDVGSFTLQPGTYLIKVVMLESNRNMIQVTNVEQTKVFANVLATPHPIRADEVIPSSRYIYYTTATGQPKALRTWFARDTTNGQDIIYPKRRALELAAAGQGARDRDPGRGEGNGVQDRAPHVVTPEQQVKPYEAPVVVVQKAPEPAPVAVAEARPEKELPKTASHVPLYRRARAAVAWRRPSGSARSRTGRREIRSTSCGGSAGPRSPSASSASRSSAEPSRRSSTLEVYQARQGRAFSDMERRAAAPTYGPESPPASAASEPSPLALEADPLVLGRIEIPRIGISAIVREGDDDTTLGLAVGHIPGTARPGERGNMALAGHRDSFFRALRNIRLHDTIRDPHGRPQLRVPRGLDRGGQRRRRRGSSTRPATPSSRS